MNARTPRTPRGNARKRRMNAETPRRGEERKKD
jgi:hypothetical protein